MLRIAALYSVAKVSLRKEKGGKGGSCEKNTWKGKGKGEKARIRTRRSRGGKKKCVPLEGGTERMVAKRSVLVESAQMRYQRGKKKKSYHSNKRYDHREARRKGLGRDRNFRSVWEKRKEKQLDEGLRRGKEGLESLENSLEERGKGTK